jgi:hypothetical protein
LCAAKRDGLGGLLDLSERISENRVMKGKGKGKLAATIDSDDDELDEHENNLSELDAEEGSDDDDDENDDDDGDDDSDDDDEVEDNDDEEMEDGTEKQEWEEAVESDWAEDGEAEEPDGEADWEDEQKSDIYGQREAPSVERHKAERVHKLSAASTPSSTLTKYVPPALRQAQTDRGMSAMVRAELNKLSPTNLAQSLLPILKLFHAYPRTDVVNEFAAHIIALAMHSGEGANITATAVAAYAGRESAACTRANCFYSSLRCATLGLAAPSACPFVCSVRVCSLPALRGEGRGGQG